MQAEKPHWAQPSGVFTRDSGLFSQSASSSNTDLPSTSEGEPEKAPKDVESGSSSDSDVEEKEDPTLVRLPAGTPRALSTDSSQVTWDGPDDPENPKNWSQARKWQATVIVSAFAFVSPLSSSMASPALADIGEELHIIEKFQLQMVLSIFLLAYSFGPFVLAPCSEVWGRSRIIRISNVVFVVFNTVCGFAQSKAQITAFRFIAGFGGSAMLGVSSYFLPFAWSSANVCQMGAGVLSDVWLPSERGKGFSIYQLAPILGPALGPIST